MNKVAIVNTLPIYNIVPPYHPHKIYPETRFKDTAQLNLPYKAVRNLFYQLKMDIENYNTPEWNPLSEYIKPGQTVVLKPNFVLSYNSSGNDIFSVITHPSILRALIDYSFIALNGEGKIIVADAPQMDCSFKDLMEIQRLDTIQEFYKKTFNFDIDVFDLRNFELINNREKAFYENRRQLDGDPNGSVIINLGKESEFYGLPSQNYYGADYNREETIKHHNGETHEYSVSKTILSADTIISVPKLKVHKKVGVTLNLKGLVGINTNKNYLVHFRVGFSANNGDQLPDNRKQFDKLLIKTQRYLYDRTLAKMSKSGDKIYNSALNIYKIFVKPFRGVSSDTVEFDAGNWYGNDTAWRMTVDLAKVLYFADKNGKMNNVKQRNIFCLIDGIIAGEKIGPLAPDEKRAGCLIGGANPIAVDMVAARLMGYDINKIKHLNLSNFEKMDFAIKSVSEIDIELDDITINGNGFFDSRFKDKLLNFVPHPGWVNHIEI
ncbi:MAG: DUF362 domain-containing protein [Candidatus Kapabacteria bacterium]|nr:DUF362 domain-containing protein [Candidatus Kapabacteria bacterium]